MALSLLATGRAKVLVEFHFFAFKRKKGARVVYGKGPVPCNGRGIEVNAQVTRPHNYTTWPHPENPSENHYLLSRNVVFEGTFWW